LLGRNALVLFAAGIGTRLDTRTLATFFRETLTGS